MCVFALIGLSLTVVVTMGSLGDGGSPQAGATEFQQMMGALQQMMQEQQQQRAHLDSLQQAVGTTAQGVGLTQQVIEGVVTEVVQQVQATFQQQYDDSQQQFQQVIQVVQGLQQRMDQAHTQMAAQVAAQAVQAAANVPVGAGRGQVTSPAQGSPAGSGPPIPPLGSPTQGPGLPPTFNQLGTPMTGVNPAIANAIQQGGVDNKVLAKPSTYDPVKHTGYAAFNDWSDHVITCIDAQIPGTWEVLEYIEDTQPNSMMSIDDLNLHFPNLDRVTLEYSNSNLFAVLITYTANEARNIVRQARRPHGYEVWKLLHKRFNPVTIGRQRAGLTSIANPTMNVPLNQLSSEIVAWESKITEFESRTGAEKISEAIKMAAIVSMCPNKLKDHLQLNAQRFVNYGDLREEIFTYLDHTQSAAARAMDLGALHCRKEEVASLVEGRA